MPSLAQTAILAAIAGVVSILLVASARDISEGEYWSALTRGYVAISGGTGFLVLADLVKMRGLVSSVGLGLLPILVFSLLIVDRYTGGKVAEFFRSDSVDTR